MAGSRFGSSASLACVLLTCAISSVVPVPSVAFAAGPLGASGRGVTGDSGHAWLGIAMEKAGETGVLVRHVMRGSPAEKAGLKDGDLIRAIDGDRVAVPDDVSRKVASHAPGEVLIASLSRASDVLSIRVALAIRPSADEMLKMARVGVFAPPWVGIEPIGDAPPTIGSLRGKVVLLDFWATWCGPCRILAPKLSALQARYGAQGLRVVGVTTDGAEKAALFADRIGIRYPIEVDPKGDTSRAYDVSALPTVFVIDKRGVVRDVAVGYDEGRDEHVEALLKELLAEPAE